MTKPNFDLTGRVALVTGSSQGIGYAIAEGLAACGAKVALNGRDTDRLEGAVERLASAGAAVTGVAFDVTDPEAVAQGVRETEDRLGPVDILVANAGIARRRPFTEMTVDDWHAVIDANLTSAFTVTKAVVPSMIERRGGRIITTCSLFSSVARRDNVNYAASKGGLAMMTKALAVELGAHGITVNGIAPGFFDTPLVKPLRDDPEFNTWLESRTPMRRWGQVDELAGAAVFLASDAARFVTGQIIYVDGGLTAAI